MKYRHEWKHEVNGCDLLVLRQRLSAIAQRDVHAPDGKYEVRSLYFDTLGDRALREKIDGVNHREKFRFRLYNGDDSFLRLEKKSKSNGLCLKRTARLEKEQAQAVIDGALDWMMQSDDLLIQEFYAKLRQGLRPKTIVDYTREPFVFGPGNVRVTLDYKIRIGLCCRDFLNPSGITVPAGTCPAILEVKWDEFLPEIIADAVQLGSRRAGAFSKYAACRIYG